MEYRDENIVNLNSRYISAYNEINTRIAKRQDAIIIYISIMAVVVSFVNTEFGKTNLYIVGAIIPFLTFIYMFLNIKHDSTILKLREYLYSCEEYTRNQSADFASMPAYHMEGKFIVAANNLRTFHDYAISLLILFTNGIALAILIKSNTTGIVWTDWPFFIYYFFVFGPAFLIVYINRTNYKKSILPSA